MDTHIVIGAGPVGAAIARLVAAQGHDVILASRSGAGPSLHGVNRVAVDAADATALGEVTSGASVIYNALNPTAYHAWALEWPPMWIALMKAAERSGAVLATVSNLYAYGTPDGPMHEETPVRPVEEKGRIRAQMWADAEQAHHEGRFRALEVRGSDYIGVGTESSLTRALRSRDQGTPGSGPRQGGLPHSWTHPDDVAALIVAASADETAHGRVWHVPTNPPRTQREVLVELCAAAGAPQPRISETPDLVIRAVGLFDKNAGAAAKVAYQFRHAFVIDDRAARARFGLRPRPWAEIVAEVGADLRAARNDTTGPVR